MKHTVTEADLDAAINACHHRFPNHYTSNCLIAQFAKRITGRNVEGSIESRVKLEGDETGRFRTQIIGMHDLVEMFDGCQFEEIRAQLPREVEVNYNAQV